ncbi:MAG: S41 family peptidase [Burkholderiaceae bacterium]
MTSEAQRYLDAALALMRDNALHRGLIDLAAIHDGAYQRASGASSAFEVYGAIRWATSQLQDKHSFFAPPAQAAAAVATEPGTASITLPTGHLRADHIAYLSVPAFRGSAQLGTGYINRLHVLITELDSLDPLGWMLDLSQNTGGNMWPMLAGVGPLLDEGPAGSFRAPAQREIVWGYRAGEAFADHVCMARATAPSGLLRNRKRPIALLTGRRTASSGEAIVVAFAAQVRCRRFGTATHGVPTANRGFPLADGAALYITVSRFANRLGYEYAGAIEPDDLCDGSAEENQAKAASWIRAFSG